MEKRRLNRLIEWLSLLLERRYLSKPRKLLRLLAFVLVVCVLIFFAYASVSTYLFSTTIGSRGMVKALGLGVYWDSGCKSPVSYIDWGIIEPGVPANATIYIRNEGNVPVNISLETVNWSPLNASSHIELDWNYTGQLLMTSESIQVTLALLVSPVVEKVDDFSFDIVITAIG